MSLQDYLALASIIISIALIAIILLQVKGEGVGGLQSGSFVRTRRGLEKTLFQLTIVLVVLFLVVSAVSVATYKYPPAPSRAMSHRRVPRPQWPLLVALFLGVTAITVLWFILANPLDSSPDTDSEQHYVEAVVGAPARVNPLFAPLNDTDADLASLVFSGLTRLGPAGGGGCVLAAARAVGEGGRGVVFC